jgi:hypothetical protein
MVQPRADPIEITDAISVRVGKRLHVDLVDDAVPPPLGLC